LPFLASGLVLAKGFVLAIGFVVTEGFFFGGEALLCRAFGFAPFALAAAAAAAGFLALFCLALT
jgi:hypothetical protein